MGQRDPAKSGDAEAFSPQARKQERPLQVALPCADSIKVRSPRQGGAAKRDVAQVTLSTIGDVSMAAGRAIGRVSEAPRTTRWLPVLGFFLLLYLASCAVALYTLQAAPWMRAFLAPLFPVLVASVAFWLRQRWKFRARAWRFESSGLHDALGSLGHEAINAVNAIRANLIAFRLAHREAVSPEHLEEIELATKRIEAAVQRLQEPVKGKESKQERGEAHPTAEVAEATRGRIA
jgi:hypothetical protein